jgi:serine phosphatase RsbU (regulator of sigma subunit)
MKKFISRLLEFHESVIYGTVSFEETGLRFLLTIYFYGGISGLLATIFNFLLGLGPLLVGSTGFMAVTFFVLHRSLFKKWIGYMAGARLFYFIAAVYFNVLWFINGGINGGNIIFFYLLVIVIMIYSFGRERWFNLFFVMTNIAVLFAIEYSFPEMIILYDSRLDRFVDVYISIIISFFVNYVAINVVLTALNRSRKDLETRYRVISDELNLAHRIQDAIVSSKSESSEYYEYSAIYRPISQVGGDLYSVDVLSPSKIRIFLADATGHGVQAALVTMLILSEYSNRKKISNPGKLISSLNDSFLKNYLEIRAIFSCIVLDWDFKRKQIQYAAAGHIPQVVSLDGVESLIAKTGPILGLKASIQYPTRKLSYKKHARLLCFTDGITEAFNSKNEMFGEEPLRNLFRRSSQNIPMVQIVMEIETELNSFLEGLPLSDDLTLIGIQSKV